MSDILQYVSFKSVVQPNFWHKLSQIKLDIDKLNEDEKPIWGFYNNIHNLTEGPGILEVSFTAFDKQFENDVHIYPAHGTIHNKNTIEQFKQIDKENLINVEGAKLWQKIKNGDAIDNPNILCSFFILSYADLKHYKYYYWFAFPIPTHLIVNSERESELMNNIFDETKIKRFDDIYSTLQSDIHSKQFFIIHTKNTSADLEILPLSAVLKKNKPKKNLEGFNLENLYFTFADPSKSKYPGWPLRNFLALLVYHCHIIHGKIINIVSLRLSHNSNCLQHSLIFKVRIPKFENGVEKTIFPPESKMYCWSGWEKNDRNKFGPKLADMSESMDPIKLAKSSVDLNLKLMKWRILPELNLDIIHSKKFLLLGAGTLGCCVARNLLAWGVQHITFVDNGKVSYSNPVRQSLFTHEDCLNGGKLKAQAAAENLKKIYPGVITKGVMLHIPMPGHSVGESMLADTKKSVQVLSELVKEHDVIFLLMDSRESRWLPTVLGAAHKKIVINAALGFDTYLVMRHGIHDNTQTEEPKKTSPIKVISGNNLGCYFCNDVTAPGNSLQDRTLDQQCTVTRPGVANIAGSLAVELVISILQHKDGPLASAFITHSDTSINDEDECLLGIVPHSIRGFLSSFSHVLPATEKYTNCIACSDVVLKEYKNKNFEFLLNAFNCKKYLEDLTGLTEIHNQVDASQIWAMSESDDED